MLIIWGESSIEEYSWPVGLRDRGTLDREYSDTLHMRLDLSAGPRKWWDKKTKKRMVCLKKVD